MLFIISGPTGSGKDTIIQSLLEEIDGSYKVPSTVTRAKRPGEVGYHYVSHAQFNDLINKNAFLEYVNVHGDDYYGTLKSDIADAETNDKIAIKILDVVGYQKIKDMGIECTGIFIDIGDIEELERRIILRGESKQNAKLRLDRVKFELDCKKYYDYVIGCSTLDENIAKCKQIILKTMKKLS